MSLGISTVYQELMLCENLSVVENVYLGRELRRGSSIDWAQMHRRAGALLDSFGVRISTRALVRSLPIAQRQIVEIAKAINLNTEVLILDEPTSSLTVNETRVLFDNLRKFKARGMTVIFISHRLEEVFEVTDRISVLRDGKYLGTYEAAGDHPAGDHQPDRRPGAPQGVRLAGAPAGLRLPRGGPGGARPVAREALPGGELPPAPRRAAGLLRPAGSGPHRADADHLRTVPAGRRGRCCGTASRWSTATPGDAIRGGFAFIPEDRRRQGLFGNLDVKDNLAVIHDRDITTAWASSRRARSWPSRASTWSGWPSS